MLTFAAAVFFLLITPGPGVLTTAGVGAGYGRAQGLRFLTGLFIGTNLVAIAVVGALVWFFAMRGAPAQDGGVDVDGMTDVTAVPKITDALTQVGYNSADIEKIWSGTVLRLMREVETPKTSTLSSPDVFK